MSGPAGRPVLVIGAGWSGATVARTLHDAGVPVHVAEAADVVGGHARAETLDGVVYEPHGAHIFHTSDPEVAALVQRFGMRRTYEHRVLTEVHLRPDDDEPVLLSWPPQIGELRELPIWSEVERELSELPALPQGDDFETWVVSLMGRRLYELFIEGYTKKQWGCDPSELSSALAPKRVELRSDGYTRLFRDRWEFFPASGVNGVVEEMLRPVATTCGVPVSVSHVRDVAGPPAAVVVTAALDDFAEHPGLLEWRGIRMRSTHVPTEGLTDTVTPAYVVNRPSLRVPYTRTVETKHATGQRIAATVVSEEHPGAPERHYPVLTPDRRNETANGQLQQEIRAQLEGIPTFFCGRLATYSYIDQDVAIGRGLACAETVLRELSP
jgi:UDP-galactopyranose mutase